MNNKNDTKIITVVSYTNAEINKFLIFKENKGKSGIYRWNSLITGKTYIGSSVNLSRRFINYFNLSYLERETKKRNSMIYSALLKYGYSNFSLDILEYCSIENVIRREQYYIDLLKPEYNILKVAGSTLGFKHSEETKAKMSISNTGKNNPLFGRKHSNETKLKIKISTSGSRHHLFGKHHTDETKLKIKTGISRKLSNKTYIMPKMTLEAKLKLSLSSVGIKVMVYDKSNNIVNEFSSIRKVAKHFDVSSSTIDRVLNKNTPYKGFLFKSKIKDNRVWVYSYNHQLIKVLNNTRKTSQYYNIPNTTLQRYIKSGKLYKNKFYFYNVSLNKGN